MPKCSIHTRRLRCAQRPPPFDLHLVSQPCMINRPPHTSRHAEHPPAGVEPIVSHLYNEPGLSYQNIGRCERPPASTGSITATPIRMGGHLKKCEGSEQSVVIWLPRRSCEPAPCRSYRPAIGLVHIFGGGAEGAVGLPSDVSLRAADDLLLPHAFTGAAFVLGTGALAVAQPDQGDQVHGTVDMASGWTADLERELQVRQRGFAAGCAAGSAWRACVTSQLAGVGRCPAV